MNRLYITIVIILFSLPIFSQVNITTFAGGMYLGQSKQEIMEKWRGKYEVNKNVHIVPTGIEIDRFYEENVNKDKKKELQKLYNISKKDLTVIFVGRLAKEKNIEGYKKSTNGTPGEKIASIDTNINLGNILLNTKYGIYGEYLESFNSKLIETASKEETHLGKAQIATVLNGNKIEAKIFAIILFSCVGISSLYSFNVSQHFFARV